MRAKVYHTSLEASNSSTEHLRRTCLRGLGKQRQILKEGHIIYHRKRIDLTTVRSSCESRGRFRNDDDAGNSSKLLAPVHACNGRDLRHATHFIA